MSTPIQTYASPTARLSEEGYSSQTNDFVCFAKSRCGFTLIELLAAIAVIAILCSLAFRGINKSRDMANRASCASNLRQIFQGVQFFTQDYGAYPNYQSPEGSQPSGVWAKRLQQYIPSELTYGGSYSGTGVFICPERVRQYPNVGAAKQACSYGFNNMILGNGNPAAKMISPMDLTSPVSTILIADGAWSESGRFPFQHMGPGIEPGSVRDRSSGGKPGVDVHGDGAGNIVYADGHVAWFSDTTLLNDVKYRNRSSSDLWNVSK